MSTVVFVTFMLFMISGATYKPLDQSYNTQVAVENTGGMSKIVGDAEFIQHLCQWTIPHPPFNLYDWLAYIIKSNPILIVFKLSLVRHLT